LNAITNVTGAKEQLKLTDISSRLLSERHPKLADVNPRTLSEVRYAN